MTFLGMTAMKSLLPDLWSREFPTDPFRALRRDLLGREFANPMERWPTAQLGAGIPAMNVAETETAIEATLKFRCRDKDIKVAVDGNRLTISGEKTGKQEGRERLACGRTQLWLVPSLIALPFESAADAVNVSLRQGRAASGNQETVEQNDEQDDRDQVRRAAISGRPPPENATRRNPENGEAFRRTAVK